MVEQPLLVDRGEVVRIGFVPELLEPVADEALVGSGLVAEVELAVEAQARVGEVRRPREHAGEVVLRDKCLPMEERLREAPNLDPWRPGLIEHPQPGDESSLSGVPLDREAGEVALVTQAELVILDRLRQKLRVRRAPGKEPLLRLLRLGADHQTDAGCTLELLGEQVEALGIEVCGRNRNGRRFLRAGCEAPRAAD